MQKKVFLEGEGDKWFERNKSSELYNNSQDTILEIIEKYKINPRRVLEIGCSNGIRLQRVYESYNCDCYGIDPSKQAIESGKNLYPNINLKIGTADDLAFENGFFDLIIFGFCLYLCDREDLFKIAYNADRCLTNKGHVIIKDFNTNFSYANKYVHKEGVLSFKMNYNELFTWHPYYSLMYLEVITFKGNQAIVNNDDRIAVSLLLKNIE
ncbi:MAG: class I SAM-dependent methyltransferase [Bacteroidota bacterium]|nr:class I SAM-dependent methyltransferase [Bacteroidota bacterium]